MIEINGVTKHYKEKKAVDDLSFEIKPGEVTGFLGPNGSGKSTTMRMIMGLDAPDSGSISINGERYRDLPLPLREVGALLEAKAIHPGRSAFNHLWFLAQSNDIPRSRVDEVLRLVGLEDVAKKEPANSRSAWASGSASLQQSSATPGCSSSTSPSMAWTRRGFSGCATS